jgi:hypothetical protein
MCVGIAAAPVNGGCDVGFVGEPVPEGRAPVPEGRYMADEVPLTVIADVVAARTATREMMENCMMFVVRFDMRLLEKMIAKSNIVKSKV